MVPSVRPRAAFAGQPGVRGRARKRPPRTRPRVEAIFASGAVAVWSGNLEGGLCRPDGISGVPIYSPCLGY